MKSNLFYLFFALLLVGFLTQGFQCGSPEFVGAKVQEQNKKYTEAVKLYEKEVQQNPTNLKAWFRLGYIRGVELKDFAGMNQAFRELEKQSNAYSSDIHAIREYYWAQYINNGVNYKNRATSDSLQFCDKAIEEYKMANMAWPDTAATYRYLAGAYQAKGDIANTILNLSKVWEMDHDKDAYKTVGRLYVQQGLDKKDTFKAENADMLKLQKYLKEINKGSYKSDVTQAFGVPDSQKKDKKNPKREDWVYNKYTMTLTFDGERVANKKVDKPYDLKIDSTKYYEAIAEFNKAIDVFEAVKKMDPKDNENMNLLLQAYYEADRSVEATKAFKLAVENDPGNKMNRYILGLLYRSVSDYDGAISEFSEALKIDSSETMKKDSSFSGNVLYDIGATYYNWGVKMKKASQEKGDDNEEYKEKFKAALPWMEKMTKIKKDNAIIWESLGTVYALLGQAEKATKALDEADKLRRAGK